MTAMNVTLWNGKTVPRIGIGTWVMGGRQFWNGQATGWAGVTDDQSLEALHGAFERGVRIIDTADQYGAGHAERIISRALGETALPRQDFVICTKVGMVCDPESGDIVGLTSQADDITAAIDASLERFGVDHLDLVMFHLNHHPIEQSQPVFEAFSRAYEAGKIGGFGWSNDDVTGVMAYADLPGFVAVQHDLNLFSPADDMLRAAESRSLWSFNRQPLAMGLLTGKYTPQTAGVGPDDIRGSGAAWLRYFGQDGAPNPDLLKRLDRIRDLLTADGRSLTQGALGWCLAQSDRTIPIPGCRTAEQSHDNFGAIEYGPLSPDVTEEVDRLLGGQ